MNIIIIIIILVSGEGKSDKKTTKSLQFEKAFEEKKRGGRYENAF